MCVCLITLLYNFAIFIIFFGYFLLLYAVMYLQILKQKQTEKKRCLLYYYYMLFSAPVEIDIACIKGRNMGINVSRP